MAHDVEISCARTEYIVFNEWQEMIAGDGVKGSLRHHVTTVAEERRDDKDR